MLISYTRRFLVLLVALLLVRCDSFTDIEPESQRTVEGFFDTRQNFVTALNGAYDALQQQGTFNRNYWVLFEMRSDNTDPGPDVTGLARELFVVNQFQEQTTNEAVTDAWIASYQGIERANAILDGLEGFDGEAAFEERVRGEALFIRSLLYFHLATAFGNIPLKTESTTSISIGDTQSNQVPAAQVYDQLMADLETAQAGLPETVAPDETGRATRGAANALLGKVALQAGDTQTAETALRRVVDSGQYELLDAYADLWGPANENNAESIFEVQFVSGGQGEGSRFTNTFSPSDDLQEGEGLNENRPTGDMIAAYESGDERFAASLALTFVDANGETIDSPHIVKFESEPFQNFDADNNWIVLRYADVLLMLAEALGPTTEAWDLIDEVRARAGLDPVNRSDFAETLLQERRVELAFENHRWIDLRRFESAFGISAQDKLANELEDVSGFNTLFCIPQSQVDVAGLAQNDGCT